VRILKNQLQAFSEGHIIFKYTIPRKGNVYWTQLVLKYGWLCICRIISGLLKPEGGIEHGKPFSV